MSNNLITCNIIKYLWYINVSISKLCIYRYIKAKDCEGINIKNNSFFSVRKVKSYRFRFISSNKSMFNKYTWNITTEVNTKTFSTSSQRGFNNTRACMSQSEELTKFIKDKNINPCFIYEDLSILDIRMRILNETKHLGGIYLILNKITLDYYIGSAVTGKIHAKFINHLLYFKGSKTLKLVVKKFKLSSFAFMVLELFPEIINKENNKKLLDLEDFYLKSLLPNYNIIPEASKNFGYRDSKVFRLNFNTKYREEYRIEVLNSKATPSLSIISTGLSISNNTIYPSKTWEKPKARYKALRVYNLNYTVFGEFSSIAEAAKYLSSDQKTINRTLKTQKKILKRRWILKYI